MEFPLLPLPANRVRRNYRGGKLLDALEGLPAPADSDRPEDWIASTVPARNPGLPPQAHEGLAAVDLPAGRRLLRDLFAGHGRHYLGAEHFNRLGPELGFLAKLLDSSMRLHVQAHPTAEFAQRRLGSRWGKLETYVILDARPGVEGYIRLGFQRAPSPAELRRIVLEQDIPAMDAWFDPIPATPGEVWLIPGGMPHAIGPGVLMLETMEPTDLVVRCEFEREGIVVPPEARFMGRDPDFALQIFDCTSMSVEEVRARCCITPAVVRDGDNLREERLIGPEQTDCFSIRRLTVSGPAEVESPGVVSVGLVAAGQGEVVVDGGRAEVGFGSRFLVAAGAGPMHVTPAGGEPLVVLLDRPGA